MKMVECLVVEVVLKWWCILFQVWVQKWVVIDIFVYCIVSGDQDIGEGIIVLIEYYGIVLFQLMEGLCKVIIGQVYVVLLEMIGKFECIKLFGCMFDKVDFDNIVFEVFGENSGDLMVKILVEVWGVVLDGLCQCFNWVGGDIGKLENWGLFQVYDVVVLLWVGKDIWKDVIWGCLDLFCMCYLVIEDEILDFEIDEILDCVWGDIVSNGWVSWKLIQVVVGWGVIFG